MVAAWALLIAIVVVGGAEWLHARRSRHLARLAFGPRQRPAMWVRAAPWLRTAAAGAVAWGLTTLLYVPPMVYRTTELGDKELRHLVLILDVSPSMRLQDSGPNGDLSRRQRSAEVMQSFFQRVPITQYRISIIACYNGAIPVVIDTADLDVVNNILNDLPMEYAFPAGKTNIFAGLETAFQTARTWKPGSTTVLLLSDGDTVPTSGMPRRPASIANVLVVGVGDTRTGRFIDGRQSRQDASTLRQVAVRLNGHYHNANEKHISTNLLQEITQDSEGNPFQRLTRREYALIAAAVGSLLLAGLPLLLHWLGTSFVPGVLTTATSSAPPSTTSRRCSERSGRRQQGATSIESEV